jgi:hypothetical protein
MTKNMWLMLIFTVGFVAAFYYFASDFSHWNDLLATIGSFIPKSDNGFGAGISSTWK